MHGQTTKSKRTDASRELLIGSFECLAHRMVQRYRHWSLDQQDIFQAAMMAVIQAIDGYDASRGIPLPAYVFTQVKYELTHEIERAQRQTRPDTRPTPADIDEDDDEYSELWDAIEKLPASDRSILISRYGLDGTIPIERGQLSRRLGRCEETITRSTIRSKDRLRVALSA